MKTHCKIFCAFTTSCPGPSPTHNQRFDCRGTSPLLSPYLPDSDPEIPDLEMNIHVHISTLPISEQKLQQF